MDEIQKLLIKHPDRIPVIIKCRGNRIDDELKKRKYLVPRTLTISEFMLKLHPCLPARKNRALFLFSEKNNVLLCGSQSIGALETTNGAVVLVLCEENAFGSFV
jgi:GABA(A) receptor-associated protein